jgi:hypothetical protein
MSIPILVTLALTIAAVVVCPAALAQGGLGELHWVGTWATSPQATTSISFNNQTLRMIVHTSIGGHTTSDGGTQADDPPRVLLYAFTKHSCALQLDGEFFSRQVGARRGY